MEAAMRAMALALMTCSAAALASGACAQQVAVTYGGSGGAVYAGESSGGPQNVVQVTHDVGADSAPRAARAVYAVIGHHIVSGKIEPGSRLLDLVDASQSQFACHVFHRQSQVALACTDGSFAQVSMTSLGCGQSRGGAPASLCIGVPVKVAAQRLIASPGETVSVEDGKLTLKPAA
jgi:hypothetical protein